MVFPANDGGVSEEDDADSYDIGTNDADVGGEGCHGEGDAFQRSAAGIGGAEDAGGSNGEAGDGAYNDGIPEGTGHVDVALTNGVIGGSSSSGDSCGAQAGFVGEAASGNAVTHGVHDGNCDGAEDAAANSLRVEGHHENHIEAVRYVLDVNKNADEACDDVEHSHTWNNDTLEIVLIPPRMIIRERTVRMTPQTSTGTPKTVCTAPEMEFAWVMLPIPKEASRQKAENSTASTAPMCLQPL